MSAFGNNNGYSNGAGRGSGRGSALPPGVSQEQLELAKMLREEQSGGGKPRSYGQGGFSSAHGRGSHSASAHGPATPSPAGRHQLQDRVNRVARPSTATSQAKQQNLQYPSTPVRNSSSSSPMPHNRTDPRARQSSFPSSTLFPATPASGPASIRVHPENRRQQPPSTFTNPTPSSIPPRQVNHGLDDFFGPRTTQTLVDDGEDLMDLDDSAAAPPPPLRTQVAAPTPSYASGTGAVAGDQMVLIDGVLRPRPKKLEVKPKYLADSCWA
ncbi:hypothetical protein G7Y89_g12501 [Cudoniella acicularis]|uniref:Uncharacterized protein n=1 Tax=Cudoniella acicularis TaxID=354080 RepID=A0A8H4RBE1_9HELO|nr:hypothetical protein G7Y89_g12501 [Cudoniella acicularis]